MALPVEQMLKQLLYVFSDKIALDFLFSGEVKPTHQTKFALEKIVNRYNESVEALNRSIIVSVAFVPIAILLSGSDVKIPMVDISVRYLDWLRLCPAISFGIQFFTLIALSWFLILRRGLHVLGEKIGEVEYFGDVSNIMLKGIIGALWIFVAIPRFIPSKFHLTWLIPLGSLFIVLFLAPSLLCGYFVFRLFSVGDILPASLYTVLLMPGVVLGFVLMGISVLVGIREPWSGTAG